MPTLRDSLDNIAPPWLQRTVGARFLYAIAIQLDAYWVMAEQGVKARFPGRGVNTALPYNGADRDLERYLSEPDADYATRLQDAIDTWRGAGGPRELINQVQIACKWILNVATPVRTVSEQGAHTSAVWDERASLTSSFVHQRTAPTNWQWDTNDRWWRAWLIIDSTLGPWATDGTWGSPGVWGDGGTWGSNATVAQVAQLEAIVRKWKPAHSTVQIIVTFAATELESTDAAPPNPNADGYTAAWQATKQAIFGREIT